jgi:hypothetical protein
MSLQVKRIRMNGKNAKSRRGYYFRVRETGDKNVHYIKQSRRTAKDKTQAEQRYLYFSRRNIHKKVVSVEPVSGEMPSGGQAVRLHFRIDYDSSRPQNKIWMHKDSYVDDIMGSAETEKGVMERMEKDFREMMRVKFSERLGDEKITNMVFGLEKIHSYNPEKKYHTRVRYDNPKKDPTDSPYEWNSYDFSQKKVDDEARKQREFAQSVRMKK